MKRGYGTVFGISVKLPLIALMIASVSWAGPHQPPGRFASRDGCAGHRKTSADRPWRSGNACCLAVARRHFRVLACNRVAREVRGHAGASVAVAESPWISLFDGKSLAGWEVANFGGEGEVRVEDGRILMDFGEMLTGITYQGEFPKMDYEIRVEAMRTDGIDFFCGLTFPVADSHCSFIAAGWAGAVVGLSCIDGKDASENETTKYMSFDNDRWYRFRVRVTDERIQAWIDDEPVIDQAIRDRRISTRPEVDLSKPLGIAAWQSRAVLRGLEYRHLDR